jgi:anti-sigma regulatory factor (Ser/Thr protein kinase)
MTTRAEVRTTLVDWLPSETVNDAVLVADELVANAVSHAGGAVELTVTRYEKGAVISVLDHGSAIEPILKHADDTPLELDQSAGERWSLESVPEGGRGLLLVRLLATAWSAEAVAGGKVVTALFELTGPGSL